MKLENGNGFEPLNSGFADRRVGPLHHPSMKRFPQGGVPTRISHANHAWLSYDSPLGGAYHPLIGSCFLFPEGDQSSRGGPCSRASEVIFPMALRTLSAAGPKAFQMPLTSHDGPLCGF